MEDPWRTESLTVPQGCGRLMHLVLEKKLARQQAQKHGKKIDLGNEFDVYPVAQHISWHKECISRESNPGHIDGNDVFYH